MNAYRERILLDAMALHYNCPRRDLEVLAKSRPTQGEWTALVAEFYRVYPDWNESAYTARQAHTDLPVVARATWEQELAQTQRIEWVIRIFKWLCLALLLYGACVLHTWSQQALSH